MMFKTLSSKDNEFRMYLHGELDSNHRAIKVNSLNDGYVKSKVTFEVVDKRMAVSNVTFGFAFLESLRIRYWIFVLLPLLVYLSFCHLDGTEWNVGITLLVVVGSLFGFSSTAQLSDILDYQNGWDQTKPQDYTVLTKGWLSVRDLKRSVVFGLCVSFMVSLILLVSLSKLFLALFSLVLFLALIWVKSPFELKYKMGGEILIYLLLGPLLMTGFALSISGQVFAEDIFLGSLFGLSSMFLYQLKRFSYLMSESRSKMRTTFVRLGFDKSKTYLFFLCVILFSLTTIYQYFYHGYEWGLVHLVIGSFSIYFFKLRLQKTVSPLGRNIRMLEKMGRSLIFISYAMWILQTTWYFVLSGLFYAN